jgi:hypothetical protein
MKGRELEDPPSLFELEFVIVLFFVVLIQVLLGDVVDLCVFMLLGTVQFLHIQHIPILLCSLL